jgi:hypothetical protein
VPANRREPLQLIAARLQRTPVARNAAHPEKKQARRIGVVLLGGEPAGPFLLTPIVRHIRVMANSRTRSEAKRRPPRG